MAIKHDIRCPSCERVRRNVWIANGEFPTCRRCNVTMRWVPFQFRTDVFGHPQWSDAAGEYVSSSRHRKALMTAAGFREAGDPVGGARIEEHCGRWKSFSYAGQARRASPPETRRGLSPPEVKSNE